ncbi:MAG: Bifunctional protein HldE [Chlamydiae bacterium]|nr:Bifunctional protein HldE [Chlamydiota bacterium]
MSAPWKAAKLILPEELEKKAEQLRGEGRTIVTLNGSFDLMHAGHLQMIYEASQQADSLILALNSDASIKRYKSVDRPLISLEHRLQMAAALQFVDFVTYFDELDPREFLKRVRPDVHVNGSEYGEECIEAEVVKEFGGRIHIVPLVAGLSTTQLIEKIKSCE